MAESTLSVDYATLQREVATFLGWPRDSAAWTNTQVSDFSYLLKRGLRWAYFPPTPEGIPRFEWSFLRSTGTITLVSGDADYDLPDDFSGVILDGSVTYPSASNKRPLQKVPETTIRKQQSTANKSGAPKYYAVEPKTYTPTTGQRFEMLVYPTPDSTVDTVVLSFRYVFVPNTLTSTNKYPVGGAMFSELVLSGVLASAELMLDGDEGIMTKRFQESLATAMRADLETKENQRASK